MVREFTFKGKNLANLEKLSEEEFAELLDSRAKRSLRRGVNKQINGRIEEFFAVKRGEKDMKPIRTHSRDAIVTPKMLGLKFGVHNGNEFMEVSILPEMLGHRLGEFALTRKKLKHGKAGIGATKSSTAITARG